MAVTSIAEGSITADGSEQTVSAITASGTYVAVIDTANMQAGDALTIRVKVRVRDGGTIRTMYIVSLADAQDEPIAVSAPVGSPYGMTVTIEQTAGTNRAYPYSIEQIGDCEALAENTTTMDGTEQQLSQFTDNKNAWVYLDLNAMQAGDTIVVRWYRTARASGTERVAFAATFNDAQTDPIAAGVPMPCPYGATVTIEQTAGSFRQIPWSLRAAA